MPARLLCIWLCLGALCFGAWIGTTAAHWTHALWPAAVGAALLCSRRSHAFFAGAVALSAAVGIGAAALRAAEGRELAEQVTRTRRCDFVARSLEQAGGLGTLVGLQDVRCDGLVLTPGTVVLDTERPVAPGTTVAGSGWLVPLGTDGFDRARYRAGARALLIPSVTRTVAPEGFWSLVESLRAALRRSARSLPERHAALLMGLTIGDTSRLLPSDLAGFRTAGLAHVLAVSGSNVAIVLGAVLAATRTASFRMRIALGSLALALFVAVVGPDGSVLRAAAMGVVALVAGGWVRPVDPSHSLPVSLLVLVAARPNLVLSAGLHLSVAATLGIVLWSRPLASRLAVLPGPVAGVLSVTLAAQVGVAPLLVLLFESVSLTAPITNVVAAPGVAAATVIGMTSAVAGLASRTIGAAIASLARLPLELVLRVADAGARPSWAAAEVPAAWGWLLLGVVATLVAWTLRRQLRPE